MDNLRRIGAVGEDYASAMLACSGYEIVERNFRTKIGEIDIVALKDNCLHFIEVKSRRGVRCGLPAEAVDNRKQRTLRLVEEAFIKSRRSYNFDCCFDVIEIEYNFIENCF